jgi:hypothetical protein
MSVVLSRSLLEKSLLYQLSIPAHERGRGQAQRASKIIDGRKLQPEIRISKILFVLKFPIPCYRDVNQLDVECHIALANSV